MPESTPLIWRVHGGRVRHRRAVLTGACLCPWSLCGRVEAQEHWWRREEGEGPWWDGRAEEPPAVAEMLTATYDEGEQPWEK